MAAQDTSTKRRRTSATSVDREAIDSDQARELMRLFKIFASETRLRLLDALVCRGELCVSELCEAVGMKPQAVSNQLQRLVDRGMLASRRDGNNVYYRIVDPCVEVLIERGLCLIRCHGKPIDRAERSRTNRSARKTRR